MSSRSRRGSAADFQLARVSASGRRPIYWDRVRTAPRSAAIRSRPPPAWPCCTPSSATTCWPTSGELIQTNIPAHPLLAGVRGVGLLLAIELAEPVADEVVRAALEAGFIVNAVAPAAIRLAPPLILTDHQAQEFLAALPGILDEARKE